MPLSCHRVAWLPRLIYWLCPDPGSRGRGFQFCSSVQETTPVLQLGARVFMERLQFVFGLLCALGFGDDCSVDVRGSNAREGIKAGYGGCFNVPSHYPTRLIKGTWYVLYVFPMYCWEVCFFCQQPVLDGVISCQQIYKCNASYQPLLVAILNVLGEV